MLKYLTMAGASVFALAGAAEAQLLTADITVDNETRYYEFQTYAEVEATSVSAILADFGYSDLDQVERLIISGSFAGQAFTYSDISSTGELELNMIIEDADALFAGIRDVDPNSSISDDDLRLYEAILEGTSLSIAIDEDGGIGRMNIGDGAILVTFDEEAGTGTIDVASDDQGPISFSAAAGQSADEAMLSALEDKIDEIDSNNADLSRFLALFTPNSIANTFDDPIAGNPTSVVGRLPGVLNDMHARQLESGQKYAFYGQVEYEAVSYDESSDAGVLSGELGAILAVGPGELTINVPLAYVDYDTGEEVGNVGVILAYGMTMNDFIDNMPWTWTTQFNLGAIGGTSDALVDTALVSTFGVTNRFMSEYTENVDMGFELGVNRFGSPDIDIDDFSQTYDIGITGVNFGALMDYELSEGRVLHGAIRRIEFHGDELAIDAQNELEFGVSGFANFGAGLTYGFGDGFESISARLSARF